MPRHRISLLGGRLAAFGWKRLLRRGLVAAVLGVVACVAAIEIFIARTPLPADLLAGGEGTTSLVDANGRLIARLGSDRARMSFPLPPDELGEWLPKVTVALEDHRFYQHNGVDLRGILAAAWRNVRHGRIVSGGSTISQQVIKLADRRTGRGWNAKIREALLAIKLERQWGKEQILTAYLNRLDYGNRRIGAEAAARSYFGKPANLLTPPEATYLAGLPQAPSRFNPWRRSIKAEAKFTRSLARISELGLITPERRQELAARPPSVLVEIPENRAPRFTEAAGRSERRGLVRTTLDLELQDSARRFLHEQLAVLGRHDTRNAGIIVIENATGAVRVLTSVALDTPDAETEINGALIPRHPGSTLKPFVYLVAIDRRILTAATLLPDTPDAMLAAFGNYDPHNFNKRFHGPVRVREALATSLNVPAVLALNAAGPRRVFGRIGDWGLNPEAQTLEDCGAGFVLGNLPVRLLDLSNAYVALARGGVYSPPRFFEDDLQPGRRLASEAAVTIVEDILCDNRARDRAFGSRSPLHLPGHRAAVKTGTSSSFRDSWTVGYDRDFTVGVWFGNYNGRSMDGLRTVQSAAPVWNRMMRHLRSVRGSRPLVAPADGETLSAQTICTLSGMRPSPESRGTLTEWFLPGTAPKTDASEFFGDGGIVLPDEYKTWCRSNFNFLHATTAAAGDQSLAIDFPENGAVYVIDRDIPATQQALVLKASSDHKPVTWSVNGQTASNPWPLRKGTWLITACSADGARASTTIRVE